MKKIFITSAFLIGLTYQSIVFAEHCESYSRYGSGSGETRAEALVAAKQACLAKFDVQIKNCDARRGTVYYSTPFTCSFFSASQNEGLGPWGATYRQENVVSCCFENGSY